MEGKFRELRLYRASGSSRRASVNGIMTAAERYDAL
jgi:hypothetical protein